MRGFSFSLLSYLSFYLVLYAYNGHHTIPTLTEFGSTVFNHTHTHTHAHTYLTLTIQQFLYLGNKIGWRKFPDQSTDPCPTHQVCYIRAPSGIRTWFSAGWLSLPSYYANHSATTAGSEQGLFVQELFVLILKFFCLFAFEPPSQTKISFLPKKILAWNWEQNNLWGFGYFWGCWNWVELCAQSWLNG